MKHKLLFYLLLALIATMVIACQPTPNAEAVVSRAEGTLEQAVRAVPEKPYHYEAPAHWKETMTVRDHSVIIDADVEVPKTDEFPVYTLHNSNFDRQMCIDTLSAVYGDAAKLREQLYSYDEVLTDLQNVEKGMLTGIDEVTGELIWQPYEGQEEDAAKLRQLLTELDVQDTFIPFTASNLDFPVIDRAVQFEDGQKAYIYCTDNFFRIRRDRSCNIQLENWVLQGDATPGERRHPLENIQISEQDAIEAGNQVIKRLGQDGNIALASSHKARATESYTYRVLGEGYLLTYVQNTAGAVPFDYRNYIDSYVLAFTQKQDAYAEYLPQEWIEIFITENGVLSFAWGDPKEIVNTANSNVALLSFDKIQESIRNLLTYGVSGYDNTTNDDFGALLISRITLGTSIQQVPDQGEEAFLVPTWMVTLTTENDQEKNIDLAVLMINALDGSYVSRLG
ncbi:MAG TPA: DUF6034 family protein [Candidatus Cryosericum sp.]|nr:DUF6034 family protein [Candidatus Cryosericum sp.]